MANSEDDRGKIEGKVEKCVGSKINSLKKAHSEVCPLKSVPF